MIIIEAYQEEPDIELLRIIIIVRQ